MQAPCSGNELLTPRPFHFWFKIELLLFSGTTLGSCVAFPSNGKFREVAPPLSPLWLCGRKVDLKSSACVPGISSDCCCGCLGPQDGCSCSRMWKIKRTWGGSRPPVAPIESLDKNDSRYLIDRRPSRPVASMRVRSRERMLPG